MTQNVPKLRRTMRRGKAAVGSSKSSVQRAIARLVFYVLTVVLSSRLSQLFANTPPGTRCADKTRQALAFEQLRTQRTHIIVYAGGYFEIFETLSFVQIVLQWSPPIQERLRTWLAEPLSQMQKRE